MATKRVRLDRLVPSRMLSAPKPSAVWSIITTWGRCRVIWANISSELRAVPTISILPSVPKMVRSPISANSPLSANNVLMRILLFRMILNSAKVRVVTDHT